MKSMNLIIIGAVIIVLLVGAYFFIQGQSNPATSTAETITPEATTPQSTQIPITSEIPEPSSSPSTLSMTVEYTDGGFVPKTITVKEGTTVTWTNQSSSSVWVASNPHPAHSDLPGFDSLKGISPGETYSYTFTKLSNWGYHNHMKPSNIGTVTVEK